MGMGRYILMATLWARAAWATIPAGEILTLAEIAIDAPYVIAMGACWCPGCEENKPILEALAYRGVPVVYIHYDEEPRSAQDCAHWYDIGDPKGSLLQKTGLKMMPTTVIMLENGESWDVIGLLKPGSVASLEGRKAE